MKMTLTALALLLTLGAAHAQVSTLGQSKPDARAVKLLADFLKALTDNKEDMNKAVKAALPYLHKSLLVSRGDDVTRDLRDFSFKKAWQNAGFYAQPPEVTRVRMTSISAIGFRETAEKGRVADYFITKAKGVNGLPAPVKIFFPADGGDPKISYVGSL